MPPVSATITFSADDPADLGKLFIAFGEALAVGGSAVGASVEPSAADGSPTGNEILSAGAWYRQHGRQFVDRLRPNARLALEVIVREGPTVPIERVREELGGMKGPKFAGSLASIGAAVTGLGAPAVPFHADHKRQVYTIEPDVQDALRDVLAQAQ